MSGRLLIVVALGACVGAFACRSPTEPEIVLLEALVQPGTTWANVGAHCDDSSPAVPMTLIQRKYLNTLEQRADFDADVAAVARKVPGGFGGYLLFEDVPTIYLVEPGKRVHAISKLRDLGVPVPSNAAAIRGRWDFAQMYDWYRYILDRTASIDGIYTSDISEGVNRIVLGVRDEGTRAALERALKRYGVPCRLVAIRIQGPIEPR